MLDDLQAAFGISLGKLIIAVASIGSGILSDRLPQVRYGRRKIFLAIGSPLLMISSILVFSPTLFIQNDLLFVWYITWNSILHFSYGIISIPYQALVPEITSPEQRVEVSKWQNIANLTATLVSFIILLIMTSVLQNDGDSGFIIIFYILLFFGILEVGLYLPTLIYIRENNTGNNSDNKLIREIKSVLRNFNFIKWLVGQGIMTIVVFLLGILLLDTLEELLGLTDTIETLIFGVLLFISVLTGFYIWTNLAKVYGKKKILLASLTLMTIQLPFLSYVGSIPIIPDLIEGYLYALVIGIGFGGYYTFVYAIIADLADQDERRSGINRAGLYTGVTMVAINVFQSASGLIAGFLTGGYFGLELFDLGWVSSAILLFAYPFLLKVEIDPFHNS